jgi:trimethylamine:corrinoid methyltransferase-like protein
MATDHTFAHFRDTVFEPKLMVRTQRAGAGARDHLSARAEDRVEQILSVPAESCIDEAAERELLAIEKRYSE